MDNKAGNNGGGGESVLEPLEVTENGTYTPDEGVNGFSSVTVDVQEEMNEVVLRQGIISDFASDQNYYGLYTAVFGTGILESEIILGQTYVVAWDEVLYEVIAQDGSSVMSDVIYLGNGSAFGLSGNGEPFIVAYIPNDGVTFFSLTDTATSHDICIMKRVRPKNQILQYITITENGHYTADEVYDGFDTVVVQVSGNTEIEDAMVTMTLSTYTNDRVTTIGASAFYACRTLTTVSFPACTTINSFAFYACDTLDTVSFPVCTTIGSHAFRSCYALTSVNFPACSVIDAQVFRGCYTLSTLYLGGSSICTLNGSDVFTSTPFAGYKTYFSGSPYIYVPSSLIASYKAATNWTYFSKYFSAIENAPQ